MDSSTSSFLKVRCAQREAAPEENISLKVDAAGDRDRNLQPLVACATVKDSDISTEQTTENCTPVITAGIEPLVRAGSCENQPPAGDGGSCENQEGEPPTAGTQLVGDAVDECETTKSKEHRIPEATICPCATMEDSKISAEHTTEDSTPGIAAGIEPLVDAGSCEHQPPVGDGGSCENEEGQTPTAGTQLVGDAEDECETPRSNEHRIPEATQCPPAPRKPRPKRRRESPPSDESFVPEDSHDLAPNIRALFR